jgi:heme/copper-type cytochrome/quinol oxidase subunit 3
VILLGTTESVLFAVLLVSYAYLWSIAPAWPPEGVPLPELVPTSVRTVLLFASSATAWRAERALAAGDRRRTTVWLITTLTFAGIFLAGHAREMAVLPAEFTWADHAYGAIYYTILNVHALHLAVGLLALGFVAVRLGRGASGELEERQLSTVTLYWHLVDGVWAVVFPVLYLLPRLGGG